MSSPIRLLELAAQPIDIVRGSTTAATLPVRIRALFNQFYAQSEGPRGLNVVFYPHWDPKGEFEIECGVQVEHGGNSSTPAGTAVTVPHFGPYEQLKSAHDALHSYVRENQHKLAGPFWEVYGHWTDDPAQLRTDIYYLLA